MIFRKKQVAQKQVAVGDSLYSLNNALANSRKASETNKFTKKKIGQEELRAIYASGVARRIFQIKAGYALKGEMQFENDEDKKYYKRKLLPLLRRVAQYQLGFGRGIIAVGNKGDDLSEPIGSNFVAETAQIYCFSGDMVTAGNVSMDLENERYYKPVHYLVRGHSIHWTRVVDFSYIEPAEQDKPYYMYGGISESELIYEQLVNDGVIQRSSSTIIEKASTIFYKLAGFKQNLRSNQTGALLAYFSQLETLRGIYGAGVIDDEDSVESVSQQINGLQEIDNVSLRRLALVTGIPVPILVGESVKGLNSTGDNERLMFAEMLEHYRDAYLIDSINRLMTLLGRGEVEFKENSLYSPDEKITYERRVFENALLLQNMGEDSTRYLEEKGFKTFDPIEDFFSNEDNEEKPEPINPSQSLNGAQVTAMMNIVEKVRLGEMSKSMAVKIMSSSFPIDESQAENILNEDD